MNGKSYRATVLILLGWVLFGSQIALGNGVDKGLVVAAQWVEPLDVAQPTVTLRFSNIGEETFRIQLPGEGEVDAFDGLDVTIDGREAKYRSFDPEMDDPLYSEVADLEPGDTAVLVVDLSLVYEIPADWREIVVTPAKRGWVHPDLVTGVTIKRYSK